MKWLVRRLVERAVEDALDVVDPFDWVDLEALRGRVESLEEMVDVDTSEVEDRVTVLEGLDLEELVERVTGLETCVESYALEGAIDRVRLSQIWDTLEGVLDCLEVIGAEWPERDGVRLRSVVKSAREVIGNE